jgi:hypothetical protein
MQQRYVRRGFQLDFEPWQGESASDEICPSCGIQFGYTDFAGGDVWARLAAYSEWRRRWIARGSPWLGISSAPETWDPATQLARLPNAA